MKAAVVLVLLTAVCAGSSPAQDAATRGSGPGGVPVVTRAPFEPGFSITWAAAVVASGPEAGQPTGGLRTVMVEAVPSELIPDEDSDSVWGAWISLAAAKELAAGTPGRTTVRLLVSEEEGRRGTEADFVLAGTGTFPCLCGDRLAVVPCWVLVSEQDHLTVMADPENPVVLASVSSFRGLSYIMAPTWNMRTVIAIRGPGIEFGTVGR